MTTEERSYTVAGLTCGQTVAGETVDDDAIRAAVAEAGYRVTD
jgi:hypothetical protein